MSKKSLGGKAVLITGGSGFIGAALARAVLKRNAGGKLILTDIAESPRLEGLASEVPFVQADLGDFEVCRDLLSPDVDRVFHLASLVSGGAERDFEAGMRANLHATINLLEACRLRGSEPRFVFVSSIATFGGAGLPEKVDDWTFQHPQNSYGVAKVIGEQLVNDYTRKGYVDGRGVRFAAIAVRDAPNTALSGYVSNLVREPLDGKDYTCPVGEDTRIPIMGIHKAVRCLLELSEINGAELGDYRTLNGRGISPAAGEIAEAVRRLAPADRPLGRTTFASDPAIQSVIDSWPRFMEAPRASALGLPGDASIHELVGEYLEGSRMAEG